jgi:hypothetical protein
MSIRISLYDFFAYTLPGVAYLIIFAFWLDAFGVLELDLTTLNSLSLPVVLLLLGAGYLTSLLLDPLAYRWVRLFQRRNSDAAQAALEEFLRWHPWVDLRFRAADWGILLRAVRSKSPEAAVDVEQHNVAAIMLRNISLSLLLVALSFVASFLAYGGFDWDLVLAGTFALLSLTAMRRSRQRRRWFYTAVYEAYTAHFLMEEKDEEPKPPKKRTAPSKAPGETSGSAAKKARGRAGADRTE